MALIKVQIENLLKEIPNYDFDRKMLQENEDFDVYNDKDEGNDEDYNDDIKDEEDYDKEDDEGDEEEGDEE